MGIIDIVDDRDVYNYSTIASTVSKDILKQWLMELKANNPTAKVISLGESVYQLDLPAVECTGSDIETRFNIPHMHKLVRMSTKHVDSSGDNSTNSLTYSVSKRHYPNLWMLLLNIEETVASDIIDKYTSYYMELGEYLITSNTANTDKLHINILIKMTGA